jgi:hypothetical protein
MPSSTLSSIEVERKSSGVKDIRAKKDTALA